MAAGIERPTITIRTTTRWQTAAICLNTHTNNNHFTSRQFVCALVASCYTKAVLLLFSLLLWFCCTHNVNELQHFFADQRVRLDFCSNGNLVLQQIVGTWLFCCCLAAALSTISCSVRIYCSNSCAFTLPCGRHTVAAKGVNKSLECFVAHSTWVAANTCHIHTSTHMVNCAYLRRYARMWIGICWRFYLLGCNESVCLHKYVSHSACMCVCVSVQSCKCWHTHVMFCLHDISSITKYHVKLFWLAVANT